MESHGQLILIVAGGLLLYDSFLSPITKINNFFLTFPFQIWSFFQRAISNLTVKMVILTLILCLFLFLIYKIISKIFKAKKEIKLKTSEEKDFLQKFLDIDVEIYSFEQLKEIEKKFQKHKFDYLSILEYDGKIKLKLNEIKNRLIELKHINRLHSINYEIYNSKEKLGEINKEIEEKEMRLEENKKKIARKLNLGIEEVIRMKNLTPTEIKVAKEKGYTVEYEYCVSEKKFIHVLVGKVLNHSPSHIFLVWSTINLLHKFPAIKKITTSVTVNPDVSFKFKGKWYAIEIEKGSLLYKKDQLKNKIELLNKNYGNRWIFLVSKRELVKKYRKFGKVSTRKDLKKNIEKWLKSDAPI